MDQSQLYLQLSQNLELPECKRYEFLAAHKLNMLVWDDIKDEFCQKFDVPNTSDHGIDLVSADFSKIAQVKCYNVTNISWGCVSTFLAYQSKVKCAEIMLVTTPNTTISKMVLWAIPNIVFMDKIGDVRNRDYYIDEITKIIKTKNMNELPYLLGTLKNAKTDAPGPTHASSSVVNWVNTHPPNNTIKSVYYELYRKSENSEEITPTKFGRIMTQMGYKEGFIGKSRTWKQLKIDQSSHVDSQCLGKA